MNLIKNNLTVLLADDDPDEHAKFIRAILAASETVKIDSTYNGMQLLDHLLKYDTKKGQSPDLIITDLYMPFAGGLQVLKQIKSHLQFKQVPIIVFSKNHDITIRTKVLEHGATEFHKKPSDFAELQQVIEHILVKVSLTSLA
jgi:CheY-like chemotaxis protein